MTVNPTPASRASRVSAVARPSPEKKPESMPLLIVRLISIIPIGPRGIETVSPSRIPLSIKTKAVIIFPDLVNKYKSLFSLKRKII
jgi:hypothetical protein